VELVLEVALQQKGAVWKAVALVQEEVQSPLALLQQALCLNSRNVHRRNIRPDSPHSILHTLQVRQYLLQAAWDVVTMGPVTAVRFPEYTIPVG